MTFSISIIYRRTRYHLQVELQPSPKDSSLEVFKVYPKDNPARFIMLQSNRPELQRHRLKHKAIDWKVIKGQTHNQQSLNEVIEAIEHELNKRDK